MRQRRRRTFGAKLEENSSAMMEIALRNGPFVSEKLAVVDDYLAVNGNALRV